MKDQNALLAGEQFERRMPKIIFTKYSGESLLEQLEHIVDCKLPVIKESEELHECIF